MRSIASSPALPRSGQTGFSLIELMIAMVIGMAAVIIMMQMLMNTDTAKRITVGGNEAQIGGTIALFNLERDIRSAGFGINAQNLLGCRLTLRPGGGGPVTVPLAPATIYTGIADNTVIPAGDPNTDRLLLVYGTSGESPDGDPLIAISSETTYTVTTPSTFRVGDQIILQRSDRPSPCNVTLDAVTGVGGAGLAVENGTAGMPQGSIVYNMGTLSVRAYAVRRGALTVCEYTRNDCSRTGDVDNQDIWVPVASNVVSLLAQYGRDLGNTGQPMTGALNTYSRTQPGTHDLDKGIPLQCAWARTLSVRVGLVARNTNYDKTLSAAAKASSGQAMLRPPTWSGAKASASKTVVNETPVDFNLEDSIESPSVADEWRLYRYKGFEMSVPLRNMFLQGDDNC